jgi:hypothetical protein
MVIINNICKADSVLSNKDTRIKIVQCEEK